MLVVWTCQTFENNFGMKYKFAKSLKETCRYKSNEQFSFKKFLNNAFIREILQKLLGGFGCYRHEWVMETLDESRYHLLFFIINIYLMAVYYDE